MDWFKRFGKRITESIQTLPESELAQIPLAPQLDWEQDSSEANIEEFMEVGGSPAPGLTLRHVLRGHTNRILHIAWAPNGQQIAATSNDNVVLIFDTQSGVAIKILKGEFQDETRQVAWSNDGQTLVISDSWRLFFWDVATWTLRTRENTGSIYDLLSSPTDNKIAFIDYLNNLQIWNASSGNSITKAENGGYSALIWLPDGRNLLTGTTSGIIDVRSAETLKSYFTFNGHTGSIESIAWSPIKRRIASGSADKTIKIWNLENPEAERTLEGHIASVCDVEFSMDGLLLASKSNDGQIRLWRTDSWQTVAILEEPNSHQFATPLAFNPKEYILATLGQNERVIRIWDLQVDVLLDVMSSDSQGYTTAKLVLVGDSGVGKTGLGWRLAHGEFKEHASTHGQQFWPITELGLKRKDGTECEAVLWDLAGQHVYRQVHSIFLDNVAAALVLFDPSNRQEPLRGVQFWLEQLKGKGQLPPTVLVGARVDRGAPAISQQELDQFCQRYGIRGGYLSTSAMSGEGLEALLEQLKAQIPWDDMTATVTTVTFKRIKDYVLTLKEQPDREGVLVSPSALREQLEVTDQEWSFSDAEMMTAVGHLETHGYVAILRSSAGEQHILLTPELLVTLASSIVLLADKHPRELGAVSETELLQGKYPFDELEGLAPVESQILLDAAILRFLGHNICFRETLGDETLLIFPGLIKQKRPLQDDLPATDDISYVVRGRVENLYASLVVLLGYTPSFTRINQWQNQAQYEMGADEICGFRLIEDRQGEIELVLYYGDQMPPGGRVKFQELFEQFLYQREVEVTPFPPVICANKHQQKRATVIERVRDRKEFMFCDECGDKVALPDLDKPQNIGLGASPWLQREEAAARLRSTYEVYLTKIKGYRRNWAVPRCYISHLPEQAAFAEKLVSDLREAGVYVVEQAAQVRPDDFVVVLDTPAYQKEFRTPALAADAELIRARLNQTRLLISLALTGRAKAHQLRDCTPGNFCDETHYPASLFDLVLNLYAIPFTHAGFAPLRQALHEQWQHTLAGKADATKHPALKIFISYAHKDEAFKDDLVTMLASLQRRGIVDAWQDRRIEAGDEWNQSIQDAMDECDLALLLVSADYLASRFIQEQEQPKLLQRRQELRVRVIPIIVRPCRWQSEPVLKDLQALPQDGKPIITFAKETGDRDQAWTDIARVIEQRAQARSTSDE